MTFKFTQEFVLVKADKKARFFFSSFFLLSFFHLKKKKIHGALRRQEASGLLETAAWTAVPVKDTYSVSKIM